MESVYRAMEKRIRNRYYDTKEEIIDDMDKLLNKEHLTEYEYNSLLQIIDEIYN